MDSAEWLRVLEIVLEFELPVPYCLTPLGSAVGALMREEAIGWNGDS